MADDALTNKVEKVGDDTPTKISKYVNEITLYERDTEKWDRQSKRIIKRFKDERGGDGEIESNVRKFNILWSNVQNLKPVLYARNPKPDIQRRFKDADPVGRVASDVLERSAAYFVDTDHFAGTAQQVVLDYLLPGRGTLWVRYVPHMRAATEEITDDVATGQGTDLPEIVEYEETIPDYVHRADFGHNICRTWDEVWLVWRKVYMDRNELRHRFQRDFDGNKTGLTKTEVDAIPLDYVQKDLLGKVIDDGNSKAIIFEAWDKDMERALWFHKSRPEALDVRDDPLKLEHFFPCPKPLLTNLANDSLIPVPDYVEYQDQANELDSLTQRISNVTKCLKVAGVYDASVAGLSRVLNEGTENELIPIEMWALFAEKGGMDGVMQLLPLETIAKALVAMYEARDKVKADLDEITGMSDIIRGNTDPNETASAQKLKSGYATLRLSDRQRDVQRFIRETIRIMVDIIANHFSIDTIKQVSGVRLFTQAEKAQYSQASAAAATPPGPTPMAANSGGVASGVAGVVPPMPPGVTPDQFQQMMSDPTWEEVEALIRNKPLRCFRIDIETDSTIKADEETEKASRLEYVKTIGEFIAQAENAPPELGPLMGTTLLWLSRAFPIGKELEGVLNSTVQKLEKQAANPQPKPDPAMAKVQGEMQLQQQKQQGEMQLAQTKMQMDAQAAQAKAQSDAQIEQAKAQAQVAVQQHLNQMEMDRRTTELAQEAQLAREKMTMEGDIQIQKAHIAAAASIEVARINAKADDGAEAEAREASGE